MHGRTIIWSPNCFRKSFPFSINLVFIGLFRVFSACCSIFSIPDSSFALCLPCLYFRKRYLKSQQVFSKLAQIRHLSLYGRCFFVQHRRRNTCKRTKGHGNVIKPPARPRYISASRLVPYHYAAAALRPAIQKAEEKPYASPLLFYSVSNTM